MEEEYRIINGFEKYEVSNLGNVRNVRTQRLLNLCISNGYYQVNLHGDKITKPIRVHRLVALAFIDNPDNKKFVDHIDSNKLNNNVTNLRWATPSENGQNRGIQKNSKSGVKGVFWENKAKKWRSQITIDGIKIHIGYFESIEDAKQSRINKANELFKEFTHTSEQAVDV